MIITIFEGFASDEIIVGSENESFIRKYGNYIHVSTSLLFKTLLEITSWVNSELGEEVLFKVE